MGVFWISSVLIDKTFPKEGMPFPTKQLISKSSFCSN